MSVPRLFAPDCTEAQKASGFSMEVFEGHHMPSSKSNLCPFPYRTEGHIISIYPGRLVKIDPQSSLLCLFSMDDAQTGHISTHPTLLKSNVSLMDDTETQMVSTDPIP
jgi:hypothetical protein